MKSFSKIKFQYTCNCQTQFRDQLWNQISGHAVRSQVWSQLNNQIQYKIFLEIINELIESVERNSR
jgi:hypothetical protein